VGAGEAGKKPKERALDAAEVKRIETLVQQAIGFDAQRGDVVSVVNAPFARGAVELDESGPPIWQQPRAQELVRLVFGGLAVLLLIFTVLRPAFRQLLAPKPRAATATLSVIEPDEELPVSLSSPQPSRAGTAVMMNFDDKLEVARTAVSTDAKRVAQVVRDMVESDG
jgi:flagellar M-ring protein FliF